MSSEKENATLTKEEKLIVTLSYIVSAILILGIGYIIATVFIEFPWEKNAPTVSPEEFDAQLLNISNFAKTPYNTAKRVFPGDFVMHWAV